MPKTTKFTKIYERIKNKFGSKKDESKLQTITGRLKFSFTFLAWLLGDVNVNEWAIYAGAHKMMETENWGLSNYEKSTKVLKTFATGPFAQSVLGQCLNHTIRWKLEEIYPDETKIIGASVSPFLRFSNDPF